MSWRSGPAAPPPSARAARWAGPDVAVAAGLVLLILIPYAQVRGFGFVNLDDQQYVYDNPLVLGGLSWRAAVRAFTEYRAANWHPLTWLSHMADVSAFGLDPGWHHLVNVLLHAANAVLLFAFLRSATGARWRAAAVAALFAVHPLHVESVAWISERKDVLSTLFLLLALQAWLGHVRRPRAAAYALVAGLLALGLMAKPMLVTAPILLLLLDAWPLDRLRPRGDERRRAAAWRCVREKLPLLALSAVAALVTWFAQASGDAPVGLEHIPLSARVANALTSTVTYLLRTAWPTRLAAFYPHPVLAGAGLDAWRVAASALVLAALGALAWAERRRRPYVGWGLAWFLVGLAPVIGIVQVGTQALADRYTYVPLVGIFVAVVWAVAELAAPRRATRIAAAALGVAATLALALASARQVATWRDSATLHRHALAVTERNWNAWLGLGDALSEAGRPGEALDAYEEALRIRPTLAQAWAGLGVAYGRMGAPERAVPLLREAVRLAPGYGEGWYNLGNAHGSMGQHAEAAACFREAVRARPTDARAWGNLAVASAASGDPAGAREALARLSALDPRGAAELRSRLGPLP